jgi:hypothetical protein
MNKMQYYYYTKLKHMEKSFDYATFFIHMLEKGHWFMKQQN